MTVSKRIKTGLSFQHAVADDLQLKAKGVHIMATHGKRTQLPDALEPPENAFKFLRHGDTHRSKEVLRQKVIRRIIRLTGDSAEFEVDFDLGDPLFGQSLASEGLLYVDHNDIFIKDGEHHFIARKEVDSSGAALAPTITSFPIPSSRDQGGDPLGEKAHYYKYLYRGSKITKYDGATQTVKHRMIDMSGTRTKITVAFVESNVPSITYEVEELEGRATMVPGDFIYDGASIRLFTGINISEPLFGPGNPIPQGISTSAPNAATARKKPGRGQ
jgi:muconolactone delta-isomerase